jgi:hypothetical protein
MVALVRLLTIASAIALLASDLGAAPLTPVPLTNGDFSQGVNEQGCPVGWNQYAGSPHAQTTYVPGEQAIILDDQDPAAETGLTQGFPVQAGLGYEVRVKVRAFADRPTGGAYLQVIFMPGGQYKQVSLSTDLTRGFDEVAVQGFAPPGAKRAQIYLYTHGGPTPKVMVSDVKVVSGIDPPPPPPPPPVPPVYDQVKDLHLTIPLVQAGQPAISIVSNGSAAYRKAAETIRGAVKQQTGVDLPIVQDTEAAAAVPLTGHLIILGNRSTNRTSNQLYDHYYSLMDLKYPGIGGYSLRSLHDPYGNGCSAILVGGSDDAGVAASAQVLVRLLGQAPLAGKDLSLGWIMETKFGEGLEVPPGTHVPRGACRLKPGPCRCCHDHDTWEASDGYRSVGYFGWNSISKRMAMYYMSGDPVHAREFIRLAFPDAEALKDIDEVDQERIENKHDPLAGPYHYNALMLILLWDLIEESPVFTPAERLQVTNAFARRLNHPQDKHTYARTEAPGSVGTRHGQWSALSLYTLARYFNKYYPSALWAHAELAGQLHFRSLHEHEYVQGEYDYLPWYPTGIAPILTYMILSGDRKPLENGVLQKLLRDQEVLISGRMPDWALNCAALDYLNKAAYLTGDGRWITYRERTQMDTNILRVGQSFWPDASLKPKLPLDLVGKWTVHQMSKGMWQERGAGLKLAESFVNMSYRSAPDASGDYLLLDGMNGAYRTPYHTFPLLEYRLNGWTLLQGYYNQVLTSADGMVEPVVPMDAALLHHDVIGPMAVVVGEVPRMPFCVWRRTLAHRTGQYGLIADDLTFRTDSQNMKVQTVWEARLGTWNPQEQAVHIPDPRLPATVPGWVVYRAREAKCVTNPPLPEMMRVLDRRETVMLRGRKPGQWLEMPFNVARKASGELLADMLSDMDRALVRFYLDGQQVGSDFDNWAAEVTESRVPLGPVTLQPGPHVLRVEVVGPHPGVELMNVGLRGLSLKLPGAVSASARSYFEVRPSAAQETTGGDVTTMTWQGAVKPGERRRVFTLIGESAPDAPPLACLQIAPNAAALALPTPAVASLGDYQNNQAELAILATDHLYGHQMTSAGLQDALLQADSPVEVEWSFPVGTLNVVTSAPTVLKLKLAPGSKLVLAGQPLTTTAAGGLAAVSLPEGRHEITGARPLADEAATLTALLAEGRRQRAAQPTAAPRPAAPEAAPWPARMRASVGAGVAHVEVMNSSQGPLLAVAADKTIHLLTPDGQAVRRFETDGKIRHLRWWDKPQLLLAGCLDEKLIAFDEQGKRQWTFISEMDPAVYAAAKQYEFKEGPGRAGVHGLTTGVFLDGQEQCFAGGACTLEIVGEQGQLVKRLPLFWGCGSVFQFMPRPHGTIDLLVAREPNDGHYLWVVNNKDLSARRAFSGVPAGHTYVGGAESMSRDHIFHVDLDGDGTKEIVSEINGAWNRITVWNEDGQALYNAQFGPGNKIPYRNMRDVDLIDLDGDGKLEIITATDEGFVVALDCQCRKLWSVRLASPGGQLKTATIQGAPAIVVGCDNGEVLRLDKDGQIVARGQVDGRTTQMVSVNAGGQPQIVLATDRGAVAGFE